MTSKKRTIAILLAAVLALSLLLTACGNGGDTPTGDNSTPGTSSTPTGDNTTPGSSSAPAETPDEITDSSEIKPVTDISKYYSADEKEFNIVKCAEDLGFDMRYMIYKENATDDRVAKRALFPFGSPVDFSDENADDSSFIMNDFLCYEGDKSQFIYVPAGYFLTAAPGADTEPYFTIPLSEEARLKEKDILITGRPVEDESAPKIYANEKIIDIWVWYLEYIKSFKDISDFRFLMRAQYDFDLSKYLSGEEFDLLAYAGDLGFEAPDTIWHSEERQEHYCEFLFEIDGRVYNAYFKRSVGDEPYAGVNIFEYPWKADENIGVAGMGFNTSAEKNIRIIGVEGDGDEGLWLNGFAFYQLVWYLDKVADANSLGELSEIRFDLW